MQTRLSSLAAGAFCGLLLCVASIQAQPGTRTHETDGSVLVSIPAGEFRMGSDAGDPDEQPVHTVRVEGFWLGQYEVTNEQYGRFMAATKREAPPFWDDPKLNQPSQPVVGVKWLAAVAYCKWAGLRLPTEAEWEYAAAAGARELLYGTSTGECTRELANFGGVEGRPAGEAGPLPVGSFPPNPFGLYDMAGNAWEWCSSAWQPYPYKADDGREDLAGGLKVMRGGCWHFGPFTCRRACRHRHAAHLMYDYAGFRVALTNTP